MTKSRFLPGWAVLRLGAVLSLAVSLPFVVGSAQLTTLTFVAIAAIGAVGLNLLTGYAGQISLGHAFFMGVGAYTAALLGGDAGVTAALWIPAAGVVAGACGALVGPAALRLRGMYLAIVSLGLVFIGEHFFLNVAGLTGGPQGREFPAVQFGSMDFSPGQQLALGGVAIDRDGLYYYLALALLAAAMVLVWNVTRSRPGRAMQGVRDREMVAAVLGVDLARAKLTAFVISSALGGICGALYASYLSFAQPEQWSLLLSIQFVAAVIVGGAGTVSGPVLGALVVFALPDLLGGLPGLSGSDGGASVDDIAAIVYGVLIIAFLLCEPRGLAGIGLRLRTVKRGPSASAHGRPEDPVAPQ
jgi:branched-chain amino acid transport system permease protein